MGTLIMTRKELAKELSVAESTVSAMCRRGMPFLLIGKSRERGRGCSPRFHLPDVVDWLRANSPAHTVNEIEI